MKREDLITDDYLEQNAKLHRETKWGESGQHSAEEVNAAIGILGITSILDYGCGRGTLKAALKKRLGVTIPIHEYDPAIPGKDKVPTLLDACDLVTCTDVLEHIEPEKIDAVLDHIWGLTGQYVFFIISCKEASRLLPDGRNAHVLVRSPQWWMEKITSLGLKPMGWRTVNDRHDKLREIRVWAMKPSSF